MWDIEYRKIKKIVEARRFYGGSHLLLTVGRNNLAKLSMNGPVFIRFDEADEFALDLAKAVKDCREALEANK